MVRTPVFILTTQQILVVLTEDWYQGQYPSPFLACKQENGLTWKKSRLPSVEIAASQWHLVRFWTPRAWPIYTTNIGRIDWMIYIKAPTQSLQLAFAQNIMWYGISLYYHSSKMLRPYRRWEIPVAYLVCFVCINDWELHRLHSHIRSKVFFVQY